MSTTPEDDEQRLLQFMRHMTEQLEMIDATLRRLMVTPPDNVVHLTFNPKQANAHDPAAQKRVRHKDIIE